MKKKFTLILLSLFTCFSLKAQIADGSIMPDFTGTDLNGNVWNLYTLLDEGKSVVVDVSAAWCAPCWTFHQAGILDEVYNTYGPNGTDQMMVLFIESESTNTLDQLNGINVDNTRAGSTQGDWVSGTAFPIIDNDDIGGPAGFNITFYPSVFVVRPDRRVYLAYQDPFALQPDDFAYYGMNDAPDDAGIATQLGGETFCGDGAVSPRIPVRNFGTSDLTSFSVEAVDQSGTVLSTGMWTGSLAPFQRTNVTMPEFSLTESTNVDFRVTMPNGAANNPSRFGTFEDVEYKLNSSENFVKLVIRTDFWPEEISWSFSKSDGTVISTDADQGTLACDTEYSIDFPFSERDCYELRIADSFGDGLLNGGIQPGSHSCTTPNGQNNAAMGSVSVQSNSGEVLFDEIAYEAGTTITIDGALISAVSQVESLNSLSIYPNPANDQISIDFNLDKSDELMVEMTNTLGQRVLLLDHSTYQAGAHRILQDLSNVPNGIYYVTFRKDNQVSVERISVNH